MVQPLLAETRRLLSRCLGVVDGHRDLSTESVRNDLSMGESALANFICDALLARCRAQGVAADLAMIDSSVMRSGLPARGILARG